MTVYEIPNVTVEQIGNPAIGYKITANEGYCIHLPTHQENEYAIVIGVRATYDFSQVQVFLISDLPEGSEVHGGNGNNAEIMSDTEQPEND